MDKIDKKSDKTDLRVRYDYLETYLSQDSDIQ